MLSYQHAYHAGNLADVHKHALLAWTLDYLTAKPKPMSYIETHAGRGLYHLDAPEARKTGEAAAAARLREGFAPGHPYARAMAQTRERFGATAYPGSPLIAALALREDDVPVLAELHPQERAGLDAALQPFGLTARGEDGLALALAVTPPQPRRGLMLIDPSYEVKDDYDRLPRLIGQVHRKWNVGIVMLWYPILARAAHGPMVNALMQDHPQALRHEVAFGPAREGHGMVGSGLFVLNPPWGLADEARRIGGRFRKG